VSGPEASEDIDAPRVGGGVTDAAPPEEPAGEKGSFVRSVLEWVAVVGGALVIALVIKTFLLQAFYIPSSSMESTLNIGDRVLVNKLSYRLHDVNRGDIVVFERPPGEPASDIHDLIKRVVAQDGEKVSLNNNGQIMIKRKVLKYPRATCS
jgi:signal peptidase I